MDDSTHPSFTQLSSYLARGWALTPLHDVGGVPGNPCSCRLGAQCRSAGKHPRLSEWQRPDHLVRTPEQLAATLRQWPSSNWGLATGLISGCWALDFDPKSVDPMQAAEVDAVLGAARATAAFQQRTGSGGEHFVFTLPDDFVPNNGSGQLPKGFDVRGARRGESGGGQIVIAPSISGTGAYVVLRDAGPLTAAAPALLDAVRPVRPRPHQPALPLAPVDQNAATRYVVAAIAGELDDLRGTWAQRNQRAWRAAARCVEMINTGMIRGEPVYAAWWAAAQAHPDRSVNVPDVELLRVWASAERHVGDRPADLSGVGGPSGWMGGDAIHFGGAPPVPALGGGPNGGWGAPAPGGAVGGGSYPQGVHGVVDNVAAGGLTSDATYAAGDAASMRHDAAGADPVAALLAEMLDVDALLNVTPPQPLINGVLDLDTTAWLIGESGSYKSFVALDLAAHVALGEPWRSHDTHRGEVVYIVAEGARGMRLRVDAWQREHGARCGPMKGVRFLPRPVQARDEAAWAVLVEACRRIAPAMVIIDTQARVTLGLEENSNTDMSEYVDRVDAIRRATGACVLTVHHVGRAGKNARGASALDGAQDAELRIERVEHAPLTVRMIMDKQKDQAQAEPITLRLRRSDGGTDPQTGRDLSSLVVDHDEVPRLGEPAPSKNEIGKHRALLMFKAVHDLLPGGGEGITRSRIEQLFRSIPEIAALPPKRQVEAYVRAWAFLLERGRVMRFGTSQRFAVFAPPDGGPDGLVTMNTGSPDEAPPDGWSVHWTRNEWGDGNPRKLGDDDV